jgi:3',5'-cyclic AMP phosphodiesterase CpdA
MAVFRLLHISDLHFSFEPRRLDALSRIRSGFRERQVLRALFRVRLNALFSSHDLDLARAIAEFAFRHRETLHGIIITGDLATTGMREDLDVAFNFITSPAAVGVTSTQRTPTLAASGLNVVLLPGNHDRYLSELGGPGGTDFDEVFEEFWELGERVQSVVFEEEGTRQNLGIVCADFSLRYHSDAQVPKTMGRLGQGRVYQSVLDDLVVETERLRSNSPSIGIIWAVHFPPNAPGGTRSLGLIDGRNLVSSARDQGVRHILAGHIHADLTYMARNRPAISIHCAHLGLFSQHRRREWLSSTRNRRQWFDGSDR